MKAKELGKNQKAILFALRDHKGWRPGCGWIWSNRSETIRLLDSLVRRGVARRIDNPARWGNWYEAI